MSKEKEDWERPWGCPECGTNIHWVKCSKCGAEICDYCGREMKYLDEQ
jgi:hypothetical protein